MLLASRENLKKHNFPTFSLAKRFAWTSVRLSYFRFPKSPDFFATDYLGILFPLLSTLSTTPTPKTHIYICFCLCLCEYTLSHPWNLAYVTFSLGSCSSCPVSRLGVPRWAFIEHCASVAAIITLQHVDCLSTQDLWVQELCSLFPVMPLRASTVRAWQLEVIQ